MKPSKKKLFQKWESYFQKYTKWLKEVREEAFNIFPSKSEAIILPISDSIEFYPHGKIEWEQAPHSFLGILRNFLWKITNWISFEILVGKYFEAMRDIRFLFEWSILGMAMEDAIETKMWEKYENLSEIGLKLDILRIWQFIPFKRRRLVKDKNKRLKIIIKAIERYLQELEKEKKLKKLSEQERNEIIKLYAEIFSDERWWNYSSIPNLIDSYLDKEDFLRANKKQRAKLKNTWHILCNYSHFPGSILEHLVDDVDFIFLEKINKNLFKKCFNVYFITLDLCYASILWRFPISQTIDRVRNLVNLWKKDFNINFPLTKKLLKKYEK